MIRRLNFTGRQRVLLKHLTAALHAPGGVVPSFDFTVDLADYDLPDEAPVVVEVYRQSLRRRFEFGTVAERIVPADRSLPEFGTGEGVKLRLKVVTPPGDLAEGSPARILAQADKIKPRLTTPRRAPSLLPVDWGDFREEIWRLEPDESESPVLFLSRHHVRNRDGLLRSPAFVSLVLPALLRRILEGIVANHRDEDDVPAEQRAWLRMVGTLGVDRYEAADEDAREEWVDAAVAAFCLRHGVAEQYTTEFEGDDE